MKLPRKQLAVLAFAALTAFPVSSASAELREYVLAPGDTLQIDVFGHSDLSTRRDSADSSYVVRPDGKLLFPLIGEINLAGRTVADFTAELERRLSEYIINPNVTVNVTKLGGTRVFVLGEVRNPGMFTLSRSHRMLDAVGAAGGFTQYAAKKNVYLIRDIHDDGTAGQGEKLNLNDYLKKGDMSQNVELQEGDCLYFTSNNKIDFSKDIMPWVYGYYYIDRLRKD